MKYSTTRHGGDNLAAQINARYRRPFDNDDGEGRIQILNPADVYAIIDALHTNTCEALDQIEAHPTTYAASRDDFQVLNEILSAVIDQMLEKFDIAQ